jgi:hypothetical protein
MIHAGSQADLGTRAAERFVEQCGHGLHPLFD